jgi:hypothetical protein
MVESLILSWLLGAFQPAQSTLTVQAPQAEFAAPANTTNGFTVKLTVDLKPFDGTKEILQIPDVLSVVLRQHDPRDRNRQNYPAFKMPDGSVPVLEARLRLHSVEHPDWKYMTIGIPLAMLGNSEGEHEVVLNFSGLRWTIYVDGQLLDNDFPFGYPQWKEKNTWTLYPAYVKKATLHLPAITPERQEAKTPHVLPGIQYWMPYGHNNWVGDVATIYHEGRYHVFYLYDRRHHQSKFGCGGHYFEHISTTDFKTWTEHEAATPLEEQWETIGTGAPFVMSNKLYLTYSVLTERMYPEHKTTYPAQQEYLNKNKCTGFFEQREAQNGIFPAGSTYAVSPDGNAPFKKTWKFFHTCGDPMVYVDGGGKLRMTAGYGRNGDGIWESESIDGGWRCINPGFPVRGDCTFFFRWGRFDYIIGGFKNLWSKPAEAPFPAYDSMVARGLDFYDGLGVPAVSEISNGRFLMAGWFGFTGLFGGPLVIRELIQFPDGRIGSKWMPEVTPATGQPRSLAAKVAGTETHSVDAASFMLTFTVQPAEARQGKLAVSLLPEKGGPSSCELQVNLAELRAQFAASAPNGFAGRQKSLREGNLLHCARDYAIENLIGTDKPFTVCVLVKADEKLGGSLIDAEIAGQRTMITYRPDLSVGKLLFRTEGVELKNVQVASLKNR